MNILFWNTNKKALHQELCDLTASKKLDLLVLVEHEGKDQKLLEKLASLNSYAVVEPIIFGKGKIFYNNDLLSIREVHGHTRYGIFKLEFGIDRTILLCVVHFPSKLNWGNTQEHFGLCVQMKHDIETVERRFGIQRTMVIGDFNMNPFEDGLVNASALNNIHIKSIAATKRRSIYNVEHLVFYNPMWNFFGENSKGQVPGTYYYNSSRYINYYWHIYDQLLLRPELLSYFVEEDFDILTNIKDRSLLRNSKGIKVVNTQISDHLPLFIKLKFD